MKINVNIISTRNYIQFVQPLVDSIEKYFLIDHDILINLFTDLNKEYRYEHGRVKVVQYAIPSYGFPDATLLRYHIMTGIDYDCDYIFYLDSDMLINNFVGDEILGNLVAVRHPGYFIEPNSGSWETNPKSCCCVPKELRLKYYAGGFQGGNKHYYMVMENMKESIQKDIDNGITPIWHDESAWNYWLALIGDEVIHELNPSYCLPQAWSKRVYSKIEHLPAKILALEKPNDIRK